MTPGARDPRALLAAPALALGIGCLALGRSTRWLSSAALLACCLTLVACLVPHDPADLPYRTSSILRHENGRMQRAFLVEETEIRAPSAFAPVPGLFACLARRAAGTLAHLMPASERSRVLSVASGLSLSLVALGVAAFAVARARALDQANHDIAWFLHAGGVWLDGGKIGVDVVDTNPPLVIWLSGLEVLVARALGAAPLVVHALVTTAVCVLSLVLAARALARAGLGHEVLALWAPVTLVAVTAVAGYDFGQRDHWLALLLLPYAGWALVPRKITRERALAGLLVALAVALKPHHVLAVLVIELSGVLVHRSARQLVRVETLGALACAPLYLLAIAWSAPSFWTDLGDTLAVYGAYGREVPLWGQHTLYALLAVVLAAPLGLLRPRTPAPGVLAALSVSGIAAAWLQHKNFAYHHVPTDAFACAALALGLALLVTRAARRPAVVFALLGALSAGCLAWLAWLPRPPRDRELRAALHDGIQRLAGDGTLFVFSTAVGAAFPAVNFTRARSVSPYSCLWPIPGSYGAQERRAPRFPYRTLAEMSAVEQRMVERVVAVLARQRPDLLVFDRRPVKQALGRSDLDFRRYFEAHPDFTALLGSYRSLARDDAFEYYGRRGE